MALPENVLRRRLPEGPRSFVANLERGTWQLLPYVGTALDWELHLSE